MRLRHTPAALAARIFGTGPTMPTEELPPVELGAVPESVKQMTRSREVFGSRATSSPFPLVNHEGRPWHDVKRAELKALRLAATGREG